MREPTQTWCRFQQVQRQAEHLGEVMDRLNVDALTAARLENGEAFARAQRTCLECRFERHCRRWLDAAIVMEGPPTFCPNAAFFAAGGLHRDLAARSADLV